MMDTTERGFEYIVVERLVAAGYRQRPSGSYDRASCLDPEVLFAFIDTTQPQE